MKSVRKSIATRSLIGVRLMIEKSSFNHAGVRRSGKSAVAFPNVPNAGTENAAASIQRFRDQDRWDHSHQELPKISFAYLPLHSVEHECQCQDKAG